MHGFTLLFLAALATATAVRLWLGARQVRHVAAHREQVPAAFAADIPLDSHRRAADYSVARTRLAMLDNALEPLIVLAFTLGGGIALLDGWWRGVFDSPLAQGVALIASVVLIASLLGLPASLYATFGIEQRFGFNRMTPRMYVADLARHAALAALLGLPLVTVVLWLMESMGPWWWLYVWVVWIAFNLFVLAIYPTWIAPLFNRFTPLADDELRARVERLLERCGFSASGLMVMDGSRRSSHGNAYFTGFGRSKRIVFFDTLLARLSPAQVEAVLAHELGHFRLRHVAKRIALTFALALVLLAVLGWLIDQPWFYTALGVPAPSLAAALVLFFLVLPSFTFLLAPLAAAYSRRHEFEADQYAVRHSDARELSSALVQLYKDNAATLTPDPLHSAFHDSHPPAALRIARLQQAAR
jgi:STE24 endopeptidase